MVIYSPKAKLFIIQSLSKVMKKRYGFVSGFLSRNFGQQKYLDKLSFMGIVKVKKQKAHGFGIAKYYYFWELTKKGKKLLEKNNLMPLWKNHQYKTLLKTIKKQKINGFSFVLFFA